MRFSRPSSLALSRDAFTLIELLVVITIIVILLALLVGGLERALKAADKAKCAANQRSIAQTCAQTALESTRLFPSAKKLDNATFASNSMQVRFNIDPGATLPPVTLPPIGLPGGGGTGGTTVGGSSGPTAAQQAANAVGLGHLVAQQRLPATKLGEIITCPSLDTTSGNPVKQGMDEPSYTDVNGQPAAGGSYWVDSASNKNIHASYNYRGLSYERTRGGQIRTTNAGSTFAITADYVTSNPAPAGANHSYGRNFHHVDGWNVSYGDGHASFVADPSGPSNIATTGFVETKVIGQNTAYPGPSSTAPNSPVYGKVDGVSNPGVDEAVFGWFGTK